MRRREVAAAVTSAVVAVVVLGPALGRGVVLAYDLAWSPDPRLTPFTLGTSTPAPRAVPSDAAGVVLGLAARRRRGPGPRALGDPGARRDRGGAALPAPGPGRRGRRRLRRRSRRHLEPLRPGTARGGPVDGAARVRRRAHLLVTCLRVRSGRAPVWAPAVGLAACGARRGEHPRRRCARGGRGAAGAAPAVGRARPRRGRVTRGVRRLGPAGGDGGGGLVRRRRGRLRAPGRHTARGPGLPGQRGCLLEPRLAPGVAGGAASWHSRRPSSPWSPCSPRPGRLDARGWARSWCRPSRACAGLAQRHRPVRPVDGPRRARSRRGRAA